MRVPWKGLGIGRTCQEGRRAAGAAARVASAGSTPKVAHCKQGDDNAALVNVCSRALRVESAAPQTRALLPWVSRHAELQNQLHLRTKHKFQSGGPDL